MRSLTIDLHTHVLPEKWPDLDRKFGYPGWVRLERVWSESADREIDYFVADDVETLLYIINLGTIPLHVWASRIQTLAQPDWCILDLDPKTAPFADVVQVARTAHDLAEELAGTDVVVNALHPATYMDTGMVRRAGLTPRATVGEGADAVMQLITSNDIGSGGYFNGLRPARANAQAYDEEAREKLRRLSEDLTGVH